MACVGYPRLRVPIALSDASPMHQRIGQGSPWELDERRLAKKAYLYLNSETSRNSDIENPCSQGQHCGAAS